MAAVGTVGIEAPEPTEQDQTHGSHPCRTLHTRAEQSVCEVHLLGRRPLSP